MGFKGDRRSNVFIGDFPAELPIFNAYRKSLSLEFKMDLGLEMAAKMFLRTVKNLQSFSVELNDDSMADVYNFGKVWAILNIFKNNHYQIKCNAMLFYEFTFIIL